MTGSTIVGRHDEVAAIEQFLDTLGEESRVLLVKGEPGIGKTTMVQGAARSARERGYMVLAAAPAESEMPLDFAGLADLLATVPSTLIRGLPRPQRDALFVSVLSSTAPTASSAPPSTPTACCPWRRTTACNTSYSRCSSTPTSPRPNPSSPAMPA
jgi:hypothetical protein